jgi:signal transduction histidine kinase
VSARRAAALARRGLRPVVLAALGVGLACIAAGAFSSGWRRRRGQALGAAGRRDLRRLRQRAGELSGLSTHLQQLAEKEKTELARNLHDELGGLLTAAKMDLSWLQSRVAGDASVQQRLQQLGGALDQAMDVKRRVVEELRPSLLDHFGLAVALRSHFDAVCARAALAGEAGIALEEPIAPDVAIGLFRIVQEGLANVVRHARAQRVQLHVSGDAGGYRLRLSDDGCGMDLSSTEFRYAFGLTALRHRVWALGGTIAFASSPGAGTELQVRLPGAWRAPAERSR